MKDDGRRLSMDFVREVYTDCAVQSAAVPALRGGPFSQRTGPGAVALGLLPLEEPRVRGLYQRIMKPIIDLIGTAMLFLLLLPVMLAVALALRIKLGNRVIYRQERTGRHGKPFVMYKFRTMLPDRRQAQVPFPGIDRRVCHKRDDDPRHTPFGRFLRRSSLDELPQLWNVLKGDMSLVGPRPELPHVVARYQPWQHQRHRVKPGLTGFWQISERAGGLAYESVDLDIQYLQQLSLRTDVRVLLRTVPVTVRRTGR